MTARPIGKFIPGTLRTVVIEYERVTVECGHCGHRQEVSPDGKTARCKGCFRVMVLREGAIAENVIWIRRGA